MHSHSQPLHLTSTQFHRILVSNAPDCLTEQFTINLHPGLGLDVTGYRPVILNGPFQIRVEPFVQLVDKLFGTAEPRGFSNPGFVMCVLRVPKPDIVFDLFGTECCQWLAAEWCSD